jgi:succinate dehydrogenase / fumarate reductase flavoprotein subunit
MGGVCVDFTTGKSSLDGLYAVGEATSGLHGANRLGGNSLCETVVFGQLCGAHLADALSDEGSPNESPNPSLDDAVIARYTDELDDLADRSGEHRPQDLVAALRRLLWDKAGILRTQEDLEDGLSELSHIIEKTGDLSVDGGPGSDSFQWAVNLRFMLVGAEAIFRGALMREESRGAQYREDHPDEADDWKVNILYGRGDDGQMELWTRDVPEIPEAVHEALEEELKLDYHHLE